MAAPLRGQTPSCSSFHPWKIYSSAPKKADLVKYTPLNPKDIAATKIQKWMKNCYEFRRLDFQNFAATFIQKNFKVFLARKSKLAHSKARHLNKLKSLRNSAAIKIQASFRGMQERASLREFFSDSPILERIASPLLFKSSHLTYNSKYLKPSILENGAAKTIQREWKSFQKRGVLTSRILRETPDEFLGYKRKLFTPFQNNLAFELGDFKLALEITNLVEKHFTGLLKDYFPLWESIILKLIEEALHRVNSDFPYRHVQTFGPDEVKQGLKLFIAKLEALFIPKRSYQTTLPKDIIIFTQGIGRGHIKIAEAARKKLELRDFRVLTFNTHTDLFDPVTKIVGIPHGYWKFSERIRTDKDRATHDFHIDLTSKLNQYAPQNFIEQIQTLLKLKKMNPSAILVFGNAPLSIANALAQRMHLPMAIISTDIKKEIPLNFPTLFTAPTKDPACITVLTPEGTPILKERDIAYLSRRDTTPKHLVLQHATKLQIPVRPSFHRVSKPGKESLKTQLKIDLEAKVILITSGGLGHQSSLRKLKELLATPKETFPFSIHIFLVAGEDRKLYKETKAFLEKSPKNPSITVEVKQNISEMEMSTFMKISDIMIGKTGGSTSAECIATGLRVLPCAQPELVWERVNLVYLRNLGMIVPRKPFIPNLKKALQTTFTPPPYTDEIEDLISAINSMQSRYLKFEDEVIVERINHLFYRFLVASDEPELQKIIENPLSNLPEFLVVLDNKLSSKKGVTPSEESYYLKWMNIVQLEIEKRSTAKKSYKSAPIEFGDVERK